MLSAHPDQLYDFVQDRLAARRQAAPIIQGQVVKHVSLRQKLLFRTGNYLVKVGRRLQCAGGAGYVAPQIAR